ncbi:hypothetical protein [Pontiella sp.]
MDHFRALKLSEGQCDNGNDIPFGLDGDPFIELVRWNQEKRAVAKIHKKCLQRSIRHHFTQWDRLVCMRLNQLGAAMTCGGRCMWLAAHYRKLCKYDFIWSLLKNKARYRILRKPNEGTWDLQLYNVAGRNYASRYSATVRFLLNDNQVPIAFHLTRGNDNKVFITQSLSQREFSEVLLAHFSYISAGNSLEDDLDQLKFLHENAMISTPVYAAERKQLILKKS